MLGQGETDNYQVPSSHLALPCLGSCWSPSTTDGDPDLESPPTAQSRAEVAVLKPETSRSLERLGDPSRSLSKGMAGPDEDSGVPGRRRRLGLGYMQNRRGMEPCRLLETKHPSGLGLTGLGGWRLPTAIFGVGARPPMLHPHP